MDFHFSFYNIYEEFDSSSNHPRRKIRNSTNDLGWGRGQHLNVAVSYHLMQRYEKYQR